MIKIEKKDKIKLAAIIENALFINFKTAWRVKIAEDQ